MRKCWICDEDCDRLSTEHIIPRHFGGIVTTTKFSCQECNQALGKSEEQLNRLSILAHYFDNAQGDPGTVTQLRGARSKETEWPYGDSPTIQVSTSGHMRSDGWKRPPGKNTTGHRLWLPIAIPSSLPVEHVHKSMVKAVMALAAHVGFPRDLFEAPLEYLAGNDQRLNVMQPTDLGIPAPEVFARVWVFAPPTRVTTGVYGAVAYGPLSSIYRLCTIPVAIEPFCYELRAYSRGYQLHRRQEAYLDWRSVTLGEIAPPSMSEYVGRFGPLAVTRSRRNGLLAVEASPSDMTWMGSGLLTVVHPLELTHGLATRFENWLRSTVSEEEHAQFLAHARQLDEARRLDRQVVHNGEIGV